MAYMDEMKARSVEAEYFHQRPRSNFNTLLIDLKKQAINHNISSINSAAPWPPLGTVLTGASDLDEIARLSTEKEKSK